MTESVQRKIKIHRRVRRERGDVRERHSVPLL